MLWGIPADVNRFFRPVCRDASRPIRKALAPMVLAFLLAPHYRRLKTIAGMVLGHRVHVATISRRLVNPAWTTRDWYERSVDRVLTETNRFERPLIKGRKRKFMMIIDTTLHTSVGERMENLLEMSKRKDPRRRNTRHHVLVMGLIITECGMRIPLPRRSYYTKEYCKKRTPKSNFFPTNPVIGETTVSNSQSVARRITRGRVVGMETCWHVPIQLQRARSDPMV